MRGRCTGQCFAVFTLGELTLDRLRAGESFNKSDDNPMGDDAPLLLAMLIPLTAEEATARIERLGFVAHGGGAAAHWSRDLGSSPDGEPIHIAFTNGERQITVGPLRHDWIGPGAIRAGWTAYAWVRDPKWSEVRDVFACRHWNEQTGRCDDYANRDLGDETHGDSIPRGATTW